MADVDDQPLHPADATELLELAERCRATNPPAPMHAIWDVISDAEALAWGRATLATGEIYLRFKWIREQLRRHLGESPAA